MFILYFIASLICITEAFRWSPIDILSFLYDQKEPHIFSIANAIASKNPNSPAIANILKLSPLVHDRPLAANNPACYEVWNRRKDTWLVRGMERVGGLNVEDHSAVIPLISDPKELNGMSWEEFQCLFYLGYTPKYIPKGILYGRVYDVLGLPVVSQVANSIWAGKVIMDFTCAADKTSFSFVVNLVNRGTAWWAEPYISNSTKDPARNPAVGDTIDYESKFIIDYGANFAEYCPMEIPLYYDAQTESHAAPHPLVAPLYSHATQRMNVPLTGAVGSMLPKAQGSLAHMEQPWPLNNMIDELRWVGRDNYEMVDIYLGRGMIAFPDEGSRTLVWLNLKVKSLQPFNIINEPRKPFQPQQQQQTLTAPFSFQ